MEDFLIRISSDLHLLFNTQLPDVWDFFRYSEDQDLSFLLNSTSYFVVYFSFVGWFVRSVVTRLQNAFGESFEKRDVFVTVLISTVSATQILWPTFLFTTHFFSSTFYPWTTSTFVVLLYLSYVRFWFGENDQLSNLEQLALQGIGLEEESASHMQKERSRATRKRIRNNQHDYQSMEACRPSTSYSDEKYSAHYSVLPEDSSRRRNDLNENNAGTHRRARTGSKNLMGSNRFNYSTVGKEEKRTTIESEGSSTSSDKKSSKNLNSLDSRDVTNRKKTSTHTKRRFDKNISGSSSSDSSYFKGVSRPLKSGDDNSSTDTTLSEENGFKDDGQNWETDTSAPQVIDKRKSKRKKNPARQKGYTKNSSDDAREMHTENMAGKSSSSVIRPHKNGRDRIDDSTQASTLATNGRSDSKSRRENRQPGASDAKGDNKTTERKKPKEHSKQEDFPREASIDDRQRFERKISDADTSYSDKGHEKSKRGESFKSVDNNYTDGAPSSEMDNKKHFKKKKQSRTRREGFSKKQGKSSVSDSSYSNKQQVKEDFSQLDKSEDSDDYTKKASTGDSEKSQPKGIKENGKMTTSDNKQGGECETPSSRTGKEYPKKSSLEKSQTETTTGQNASDSDDPYISKEGKSGFPRETGSDAADDSGKKSTSRGIEKSYQKDTGKPSTSFTPGDKNRDKTSEWGKSTSHPKKENYPRTSSKTTDTGQNFLRNFSSTNSDKPYKNERSKTALRTDGLDSSTEKSILDYIIQSDSQDTQKNRKSSRLDNTKVGQTCEGGNSTTNSSQGRNTSPVNNGRQSRKKLESDANEEKQPGNKYTSKPTASQTSSTSSNIGSEDHRESEKSFIPEELADADHYNQKGTNGRLPSFKGESSEINSFFRNIFSSKNKESSYNGNETDIKGFDSKNSSKDSSKSTKWKNETRTSESERKHDTSKGSSVFGTLKGTEESREELKDSKKGIGDSNKTPTASSERSNENEESTPSTSKVENFLSLFNWGWNKESCNKGISENTTKNSEIPEESRTEEYNNADDSLDGSESVADDSFDGGTSMADDSFDGDKSKPDGFFDGGTSMADDSFGGGKNIDDDSLDEVKSIDEDSGTRSLESGCRKPTKTSKPTKKMGYCGRCWNKDHLPFKPGFSGLREPYVTRTGVPYGPIRYLLTDSEYRDQYGLSFSRRKSNTENLKRTEDTEPEESEEDTE